MKGQHTLWFEWRFFASCLCLLAPAAARAEPFKTAHEKIPVAVKTDLRLQIELYFDNQNLQGIPLLDNKIDWNDVQNWPDEFTFRGDTYCLQVWTASDATAPVAANSHATIPRGSSIRASYQPKNAAAPGELRPSAFWEKDGTVHEKVLELNRRLVFELKYYPRGELFSYGLNSFATQERRIDYFDRAGIRAGGERTPAGKIQTEYQWNGQPIDADAFGKKKIELLLNYFKQ